MKRRAAALAVLALSLAFAGAPVAPPAAAGTATIEQGDAFLGEGRYDKAVKEFTDYIAAHPTEVEGYRGRIEAELFLGRFSDAVQDYAALTAYVLPVHPDARNTIVNGYAARLAADQEDLGAHMGKSFAHWWFFEYPAAIHGTDDLLERWPDDFYGNLFRGSSRLLRGAQKAGGRADLERAIALAPTSPDVRYVISDAYTYGDHDPVRALAEATFALDGGLDTPRVQAILASAYHSLGDESEAAVHYARHIELVTTQLSQAPALGVKASLSLDVVPGRSWDVPVTVAAGETIAIGTSSGDFYDTICVLLAPDGTPVIGSDDAKQYFAAFTWTAPAAGTYRLRVTSFEGVSTGALKVTRS